ncbi:MAG: GspH/FimT family pseudopilin [Sulfuricaulis sp.]|uniref:Tfp pilus assembly protein FimT/FimU n=1 Tax=Sulfuricaulis sp. TaxID=2003553 RepID=UPI0034A36E64
MACISRIQSTRYGGFTLMELVVIIVLVAILAFTVVPRYLSKGSIDVSIMAEQLANDIRFTQSLAMTSGNGNRINLTAAAYQITTSSGGPVVHPVTGSSAPISMNNVSLSGYNPPLTNNYVAFDGKGVPYTDVAASTALAAAASITLTAGGNTRTVMISPQTGRVIVP